MVLLPTKMGNFDFAVSEGNDTLRNDSAYYLANAERHDFRWGLPPVTPTPVNEKIDAYGHLVSYTEVSNTGTETDSSVQLLVLNEYYWMVGYRGITR